MVQRPRQLPGIFLLGYLLGARTERVGSPQLQTRLCNPELLRWCSGPKLAFTDSIASQIAS